MTIQLPESIIQKLTELPESGMGYQLVDFTISDGRVLKSIVVLNSEVAQMPDQVGALDPNLIQDVALSSRD